MEQSSGPRSAAASDNDPGERMRIVVRFDAAAERVVMERMSERPDDPR
jgi:hypothetical protein